MNYFGITISIGLIATVVGIAIDNRLVGPPEVVCGEGLLELKAQTDNPFVGRVYVKGEVSGDECLQNYAGQSTTDIGISLPYSACNIRRLRTSDKALMYTTTVVVSFHPFFVTKVDRAFNVKCIFRQMNKTLPSPSLEVSMIPTTEITATAAPVVCTYEIRRGSISGPIVRYASIGEPVFHVWKCQTNASRMLIRDCHVDDGQGNLIQTIDERGCTIDRYVLQTPTYMTNSMAFTEAHVFKYADKPAVVFQCKLNLCDPFDETCQDLTPPQCGIDAGAEVTQIQLTSPMPQLTTTTAGTITENSTNRIRRQLHKSLLLGDETEFDLLSNQVNVISLENENSFEDIQFRATVDQSPQIDANLQNNQILEQIEADAMDDHMIPDRHVCFERVGFTALVLCVAFTGMLAVVVAVVAMIYYRHGRYPNKKNKLHNSGPN